MLFGPNAPKSQEHTSQIENLHLKGIRHMAWNILTNSTDATKLIDDEVQAIWNTSTKNNDACPQALALSLRNIAWNTWHKKSLKS